MIKYEKDLAAEVRFVTSFAQRLLFPCFQMLIFRTVKENPIPTAPNQQPGARAQINGLRLPRHGQQITNDKHSLATLKRRKLAEQAAQSRRSSYGCLAEIIILVCMPRARIFAAQHKHSGPRRLQIVFHKFKSFFRAEFFGRGWG